MYQQSGTERPTIYVFLAQAKLIDLIQGNFISFYVGLSMLQMSRKIAFQKIQPAGNE